MYILKGRTGVNDLLRIFICILCRYTLAAYLATVVYWQFLARLAACLATVVYWQFLARLEACLATVVYWQFLARTFAAVF